MRCNRIALNCANLLFYLLRHQLSQISIRVFEVVPPSVNTGLIGVERGARQQNDRGIAPDEVAKETLQGLRDDLFEIAIGIAHNLRNELGKMFGSSTVDSA